MEILKSILAIILATMPSVLAIKAISAQNKNQLLKNRFAYASLLFGAMSIALTLAINLVMRDLVVVLFFKPQVYFLRTYFHALIEEISKFCVLLLFSSLSKKFKNAYDYVVLSASVALGFAAIENLIYLIDSPDVLRTAFVRVLICNTAHMSCGIWMGFIYGVAKNKLKKEESLKSFAFLTLALFGPSVMHALHNYFATLGSVGNLNSVLPPLIWDVVALYSSIELICKIAESDRLNTRIAICFNSVQVINNEHGLYLESMR